MCKTAGDCNPAGTSGKARSVGRQGACSERISPAHGEGHSERERRAPHLRGRMKPLSRVLYCTSTSGPQPAASQEPEQAAAPPRPP